MPLPDDASLDATINDLFDRVLDRAIQPSHFGIVSANGARLQAASQRRLVIAIEASARAQERTADAQEQANSRMERLETVGIAIAIVGIVVAGLQVWLAVK